MFTVENLALAAIVVVVWTVVILVICAFCHGASNHEMVKGDELFRGWNSMDE